MRSLSVFDTRETETLNLRYSFNTPLSLRPHLSFFFSILPHVSALFLLCFTLRFAEEVIALLDSLLPMVVLLFNLFLFWLLYALKLSILSP